MLHQDVQVPWTSRRLRWWPLVLIALLAASGCVGDAGQRQADRRLEQVAASLAREAQQHWRRHQTDPTWLAIWAANDTGPITDAADEEGDQVSVRPLAWRRRADGEGEVEVWLGVTVPPHAAVTFGDRSHGGGRATGCRTLRTDGSVTALRCAGRTPGPLPSPPAVADLDDHAAMITKALQQPTFTAARRFARSSAGPFVVTADVVDNSWVIVLTRPRPYACLAGVRAPNGTIELITPERRVMQPGEGGCDPYAIVHPIHTH